MSRRKRITELVDKYKYWDDKDDGSTDSISLLARDEKREISKIFEKELHDPIGKFLINNNVSYIMEETDD